MIGQQSTAKGQIRDVSPVLSGCKDHAMATYHSSHPQLFMEWYQGLALFQEFHFVKE